MKEKRSFRLCVVALFFTLFGAKATYSQLAAAFSANKTEGCAPLVVQFKDESTGAPTNWKWDLGNGTLSFLQNPAATYFNPGTYTIKLVAGRGALSDSIVKVQYITVYASPVVNFSATDTSGCFPLTINFSDLSIPGDGSITSWLWDFGDGDTAAIQNPQHTYTDPGNFNVSLQVKNSRGCITSATNLNYIKLNNGVKAAFNVGGSNNCRPPTPITFTNSSTGTGALTYQWYFGDGANSASPNPTHTYTAAGTYTVKLVVRNNTGCVDSLVIPNAITIGTVDAAFSSPDIICAGKPFTVFNNSSPAPSAARWDFGDGTFSNAINPAKTYQNPGTYQIKLISDFGACKDSGTRSIQVLAKPSGAFSANITGACKPPLNVSFNQTSTGAVSYKWFFGDGDSSTQANPSHVYNAYGSFNVTLISTNAAGCTDTLVKPAFINIQRPRVELSDLPQQGCVPYNYQPRFVVRTNDSLVNFLWSFGDGNTSNEKTPSYTYTSAGSYQVKLIFTTAGGCIDSVIMSNAIVVGEKPVVNFEANPRIACAFGPISFRDISTGANGDRWFWDFGDGGTSTSQNPTHTYNDTGWFNVRLIVWNNGCSDSLVIPRYINIKPPIARFYDSTGCTTKFTRWFIDRSIGATSWYWDFGDGNNSADQNPIHQYATPGRFIVTLIVKNDTCEHTSIRQIVIVSEAAAFTADDTVVCKGSPVKFTTDNITTQNISSYQWNFGDGSFGSGPTPTHIYSRAGLYSVRLIITDINGCRDTVQRLQYIRVNGPTADFTVSTPAVCNQSMIQFIDSSKSDGNHPIKTWIWNYGDGRSDTLSAPPFQHSYVNAGVYTVTLRVIDSIGCEDRQQKFSYLIISKPSPAFSSADTVSCTNKPIRLFNQSSGNGPLTYLWNFGDGNTSPSLQPISNYNSEGDYAVKLIVTDRYGCKDSLTKVNFIHIRNPRALFSISDSVATCPPLVVNFTNQAQNFIRHEWDFGDGTRAIVNNPVHFYTYPGIYRARLTVTSPGGCIDTLIKTITVRGPQGSFQYDKFSGCEPTTVSFTGTTKDIVSFIWDFNDGTVTQTGDSNISHTYTRRGIYLPKMILKDPQGCQVSIAGKDTIRIYGVDAKFGLNQQVLCDSGLVNFYDSSQANDLITSYRWDFGNGSNSVLRNPSHFYRNVGNYPVQLIVNTQRGCMDTTRLNVPVKIVQTPVIAIQASNPECIPATANFAASIVRSDTMSLNWAWDFGNGISSTLQVPDSVNYNQSGDYTVRLIGKNSAGCADTATHLYAAFPLPFTNAGNDRVICRDAGTDLNAVGALQYTWSPANNLSCTDCASPKASPSINTVYHVVGKNIHGCTTKDSVLIEVQQPFNISVARGDTLCVGETIQLFASGADQFLWSPSAGLDNNRSRSPKANPSTTVLYQVVGTDKNGCFADTGFVPVQVYPYPTLEAGADQTISVGSSAQLNAKISNDVTSVRWSPPIALSCLDCPSPVATPKQTTTYSIEVANQGGCITKDNLTVFVFCDNSNLFVPNTFSPNADGNNDVFYPRGKGIFSIKTFRVFNRWGEVAYERSNFQANDAGKGWDGTHNGKQSMQDVYVYTIEVMCENQVVMKYGGNVALIR